jgi:hypothetical protein
MPEGSGQVHAALTHVQAPAATELEVALPDMHVAMAHPAVLEPEEHLGATRTGVFTLYSLQWFAPFNNIVAQHTILLFCLITFNF